MEKVLSAIELEEALQLYKETNICKMTFASPPHDCSVCDFALTSTTMKGDEGKLVGLCSINFVMSKLNKNYGKETMKNVY